MTRSEHAAKTSKEDRNTRLDRLLRELDALLSEGEPEPEDPGTIDDIERKSDEAAERIRRVVTEKLLQRKQHFTHSQIGAQPWVCSCGKASRYVGCRTRQIVMRSGAHTIKRAYYYCASCQRGAALLDDGLKLTAGHYSPSIAATIARMSAYLSDRMLVAELQHFWGVGIAVSTAQRYSRSAGARIAAQCQSEKTEHKENRLPESNAHPTRLHLSMDGVHVHVDGEWHEAKIGVAYAQDDSGRAVHSRFTATLEPSREFGRRVGVLAHQAGADHCRDVAVVADGAAWIWQEAGKYFPQSVQILDYYHASQHLWAAAQSRYGEGSEEARTWAKALTDMMAKQQQRELLKEIRSWQPHSESKRTVRRRLLSYLLEHRDRMVYQTLKEKGYHIGSGVVEASCKNVVQSRMKRAGMRWSGAGAEAILHNCSRYYSDGQADFRAYV